MNLNNTIPQREDHTEFEDLLTNYHNRKVASNPNFKTDKRQNLIQINQINHSI